MITFKMFNWLNTELGIKEHSVKLMQETTLLHKDPNNDYGPMVVCEFSPTDSIENIKNQIQYNATRYVIGYYNFYLESENGERFTVFDGDTYNDQNYD